MAASRSMTRSLLALALLATAAPDPAWAQDAPSPTAIVAAAPAAEWRAIAAEDLLVMDLAPDRDGEARRVVIQLIPPPFSQGWVDNIRTLARARWWDGTSMYRVQDNYVAQWGDATEAKPLPPGLKVMREGEYTTTELLARADPRGRPRIEYTLGAMMFRNAFLAAGKSPEDAFVNPSAFEELKSGAPLTSPPELDYSVLGDRYAPFTSFARGWPMGSDTGHAETPSFWPVHCYGTVGVGRNLSPDTGSGAELYAVIGHAPRHLDRNIAVVGRVVDGIEHLSSLPRGRGDLGFYEDPAKRVPIASVRLASDLPAAARPAYEYLSTEGEAFARYADARANRRDPFFIVPAGGADICNIPVPVRRVGG